jgi:hypothetical protein
MPYLTERPLPKRFFLASLTNANTQWEIESAGQENDIAFQEAAA